MSDRARRPALAWLALAALLSALVACDEGPGAPPEVADVLASPPDFGGTFTLLAAPADLPLYLGDGATDPPDGTYAVFADLDGDGLPEVVLATPSDGPQPLVQAFAMTDGVLTARHDLAWPPGVMRAVADLDGDGHAEAVMVGEFGLTVYWGEPGGWGEPVPSGALAAVVSEGGCTLADLDRDGWLDLVLGTHDDLIPLFAVGGRDFMPRKEALQGLSTASGFAVMAGEVHPGEQAIFSLGGPPGSGGPGHGIWTASGLDAEGYPLLEPQEELPRDAQLLAVGGYPPGSLLSLFAPMGGDLGDVDGDGHTDLLVALDPTHLVLAGGPGWPLGDRTERSGIRELPAASGVAMVPWGMALVDLDRDGRLDLLTAHGDDPGSYFGFDRPLIGPQWVTAHWNAGDFRFVDVTDALGLGLEGNWRALAVGDLEGDGDADLAVGGLGLAARVWQNGLAPPGRGMSVRLRGTTSNALGIGARVTLVGEAVGPTHQMHLPAVVLGAGEPTVFLTLGPADEAPLVRVAWPSGHVQEVTGLGAGRLQTIVEPETLAFDPPSRLAAADGSAAILVRYTPRDPDGAPRSVGDVALSITHGPGRITAPMAAVGDGFEATVVGPEAPGSTRLALHVDGVPLPLYPRLFWQ